MFLKNGFTDTSYTKSCQVILTWIVIGSIANGLVHHLSYFFYSGNYFNKLQIGFLLGIFGFGGIAGNVLAGYCTDKSSKKNIFSLSFFITGLSLLIISLNSLFELSMAACFFCGLATSVFVTSSNSILMLEVRKNNLNTQSAQATRFTCYNIGCLLAITIFSITPTQYRYYLFLLTGSGFILLSIISYYCIECIDFNYSNKSNLKNILKRKELSYVLLSLFCIGITYGIQKTTVGVHLHDTTDSSVKILLFFILDPLLISVFQRKITLKTMKYSIYHIVLIGCMLLSVATFLMGQSNNYSELVFSLILFVTGEMFVMANMLEIADQLGGNKHTALGIGFSQAAFYTGLMCGPVAAGCSMHIFGTQSAWLISALLCLLSMIFVFPLMNPKAVQIKELS